MTRKSYPLPRYGPAFFSHAADISQRSERALIPSPPTAMPQQFSAEGDIPSLSELLSAFSFALDLTEGAVPGHALRTCLLGMRLGRELGFSPVAMADLYHALLLKDIGCSSNAGHISQIIGGGDDRAIKSAVKLQDWTNPGLPSIETIRMLWENVKPGADPLTKFTHLLRVRRRQERTNEELVQLRCDHSASILHKIGMSYQTALAVRSLDEHWDGSGYPERLRETAISPLARVMLVAQHLDVFAQEKGAVRAMLVLGQRSGRWFDPEIVKAAESLYRRSALWCQDSPYSVQVPMDPGKALRAAVIDLRPHEDDRLAGSHIDSICEAFAEVVDAKSGFGFRHSMGVTDAARTIGNAMGLKPERLQLLHRAALLHDLGKLRVPNSILDKPGKLDNAEWSVLKEHPGLTRTILSRVQQFKELAEVAGAHHEKLDGTGYPNRLSGKGISLESRILGVADIFGALTEERHYRNSSTPEEALKIMERDVPGKLDPECFEALRSIVYSVDDAAASKHHFAEVSGV
jgi:HD-GYP domain-containing protein (c-di-GMP phosphodiesterase class II)